MNRDTLHGAGYWVLVGFMGLLVGCGSTAPGSKPATSPPGTSTTTPTPVLPTAPLTVQSAFTISDTANLDVSGSSVPGATIGSSGNYGVGGSPTGTVLTDASGHFTLPLLGLPVGVTSVVLAVSARGYTDGSAHVYVTRTISPAAYKASAAEIPYNQLVKNPTALAGRVVTFAGLVFQYDTNTTTKHMIASVTDGGYGFWSDNVWLDVDPGMTANICNKTVVRFWGEVVGPYTYTTTNNGSLTIPEIHVQYITATQAAC